MIGSRWALACVVLVVSGCSRQAPAHVLTISAASSLTEVFSAIANEVEAAHPGLDVRINFGSSGQLARQVVEGAQVDLVAFADRESLRTLERAGLIAESAAVFARNTMTVIAKPGNPHHVAVLADLDGVPVVSLCVESAPCGVLAGQVLDRCGVHLDERGITREADARSTLSAVVNGDADAGIVFRTDALLASGRSERVDIDESCNLGTDYPIAMIGSEPIESARWFIDAVMSESGQRHLRGAGFLGS